MTKKCNGFNLKKLLRNIRKLCEKSNFSMNKKYLYKNKNNIIVLLFYFNLFLIIYVVINVI